MDPKSQTIHVSRAGITHQATASWRLDSSYAWVVRVRCRGFGTAEARADDAFEALCLVREELEPFGWRIGVAGAQADVWPSGMARDQGGGLRAYRLTSEGAGELVDTFEPVDPSTVTTVAIQQAEADRFFGAPSRAVRPRD